MAWYYIYYTGYGFVVYSRDNPKLKKIIHDNEEVIGYESNFTRVGEIFIYFKSHFNEGYDRGCYWDKLPDTTGDEFHSPEHPIYTKRLQKDAPHLNKNELDIVDKIKKLCGLDEVKYEWIESAYMDF